MATPPSPRSRDGFLTLVQRKERDRWEQAVKKKDSAALERLSEQASDAISWAFLAGCGSPWAIKQSMLWGWGGEPSPAWFGGFADALNTARDSRHRRSIWRAWPAIVALNQDLEGWENHAWGFLMPLVGWLPEEGERLMAPKPMRQLDLNAPRLIYQDSAPGLQTLLQLAFSKRNPMLCRVLLHHGADPTAAAPRSFWPTWTLRDALRGQALDATAIHTMGTDARLALEWATTALASALQRKDPAWMQVAQQVRAMALDQALAPSAMQVARRRF